MTCGTLTDVGVWICGARGDSQGWTTSALPCSPLQAKTQPSRFARTSLGSSCGPTPASDPSIGGIDRDPEPMETSGAPLLFMMRDPDGNQIAVVQSPDPTP